MSLITQQTRPSTAQIHVPIASDDFVLLYAVCICCAVCISIGSVSTASLTTAL